MIGEKQFSVIREALEEAEEYFDQKADAEYFTDSPSPHPNAEMRLLVAVREALSLLPADKNRKGWCPECEQIVTENNDCVHTNCPANSTEKKERK